MGIIAGLRRKSKAFLGRIPEGFLTAAIVILSCTASFGLGVLAGEDTREGGELRIEERAMTNTLPTASPEVAKASAPLPAGGQYVASKTGKSYHLPWCGGAKQIKEENKIWFESKVAAEAAGYAPAKNCKGI